MSTVLEREREIGLLIVRGVTRKQIVKAVFGEAMLIIVVSFALSIVRGLSIAYEFCQFVAPPEMAIFFTKPQLTIPFQVYTTLGAGLTMFLLTSLITTWYVTRKNLAKILRIYH